MHDRGCHWVVASSIGCHIVIKVYDSIYTTVAAETQEIIYNLFGNDGESDDDLVLDVITMQKQVGGKDCGLFAIAVATAILFGKNIINTIFDQQKMRSHLLACFNAKSLSMFPTVN